MTQHSTQTSQVTDTASIQALNDRFGRRTSYVITNTDTSAVVWIALGITPAVIGKGIKLLPNAYFLDSDTQGYRCWNGAVQLVSSATGSIATHETWED
jgi:hypothetical protein